MSNRKRIKVLHIITNLAVGGAQDNMLLTLERLNRERYDVSLLTASEGEWLGRAKNINNLNLIFVDSFTRNIHLLKDFLTLCRTYSKIKKGGYHIVHTHSSKAGFLGRLAAKLAGVPVIVHTIHGINFHNQINFVLRYIFLILERFLSNISDKLVTVSQSNHQTALGSKLAAPGKFVNIYNGFDFKQFDLKVDFRAKRKQIGIGGDEKIVGTVGRLSVQKAPQDLIACVPKILQVRKDVMFIFIGDGELFQELLSLTKKLGIESKVKFLGNRDDVSELLQILDVFVLTSLWEGMPRSITEAMYCARPVVATAVDGTPELLKNGELGILAPPRDVDKIANAIITLLNNEKKAKDLGEAAKRHVANSFSIEKMMTDIEKLYDDLLHQKGLDGKIPSKKHAQKTRENSPTAF